MNGAEYIVEFLSQRGSKRIFLVTGGACAFIVDAIAKHPAVDYVCFQHEQAAAMAADAIWRIDRTVGVTLATSGPGATNLLTGIGCSYFDSIPSLHITGQVNRSESAAFLGAKVRQAGFQETDIVEMARPITKYAVQVNSVAELKKELIKAYNLAISGRMGPVLLDIPMNVQKEDAGDVVEYTEPDSAKVAGEVLTCLKAKLEVFFKESQRPLVLFGAGIGLAGVQDQIVSWLETRGIPFVSSWNGMSYFNHDSGVYYGHIGVYGNRGANYILQNCDALLVLGSRLDNRQRSGNSQSFAPGARVHVIDIDPEESKKYGPQGYTTTTLDLKLLPHIVSGLVIGGISQVWSAYLSDIKCRYFGRNVSTFAQRHDTLSPYEIVQRINRLIDENAIVIPECGANLCWVYQVFHRTKQTIFTAGGMSPMGYTLPAAIGAALHAPHRQVVGILGDGGFQMNIQELQTIYYNNLNIKLVILNNYGYGIIKQFQDSYFGSRYEATGKGYSLPDFKAVAEAYKIPYRRIDHLEQVVPEFFRQVGPMIIDVTLDPNTLIEPKLEMGHPIHDQFPYVSDEEFTAANRFCQYKRVT